MYSTENINTDQVPIPTKFLSHRIMCGDCNFKCCNSPSLEVECTEEEQKLLKLPQRFPQKGKCRCLTENGCEHGDHRPVFCQFFPLQVIDGKRGQQLIVSHWATLCCPHTTDYVLNIVVDDFYYYTRKEGINGSKRNNSKEKLVLTYPIEEFFPTVLDMCADSIYAIYGEGTVEKIRKVIEKEKSLYLF